MQLPVNLDIHFIDSLFIIVYLLTTESVKLLVSVYIHRYSISSII